MAVREAMLWVLSNIVVRPSLSQKIAARSAPNSSALAILNWARSSKAANDRFMRITLSRLVPPAACKGGAEQVERQANGPQTLNTASFKQDLLAIVGDDVDGEPDDE